MIRAIADRFLAGQSVRQISMWLNRDGDPPSPSKGQEPVEHLARLDGEVSPSETVTASRRLGGVPLRAVGPSAAMRGS